MTERSNIDRNSFVIFVASILLVVASHAQQHKTGSISGHVVDSVGATIRAHRFTFISMHRVKI